MGSLHPILVRPGVVAGEKLVVEHGRVAVTSGVGGLFGGMGVVRLSVGVRDSEAVRAVWVGQGLVIVVVVTGGGGEGGRG